MSLCMTILAGPTQLINYMQLIDDICNALRIDSFSQTNKNTPHWTTDPTGLLLLDGQIYVPDAPSLCTRVLQFKHDHTVSGHPGQSKTLVLIHRDFVWPQLCSDVIKFIHSCTSCGRSKASRHKPYGMLQQLPIPLHPWESISMDFIEQLPPSNSFTAILVVVDRLTKQSIFIPTTDEVTSAELATLFVQHVFAKHGVPSHVTSDRGTEFVSRFFRSLGTALDMKLHFTSGYHPKADGQT